jgi:hypothetical protein
LDITLRLRREALSRDGLPCLTPSLVAFMSELRKLSSTGDSPLRLGKCQKYYTNRQPPSDGRVRWRSEIINAARSPFSFLCHPGPETELPCLSLEARRSQAGEILCDVPNTRSPIQTCAPSAANSRALSPQIVQVLVVLKFCSSRSSVEPVFRAMQLVDTSELPKHGTSASPL